MSEHVRLRPGTLDEHGNLSMGSMARAIDDALAALIPVGGNEDVRGRRKLALAIARGVIGHLNANEGALVVVLPDASGSTVEKPVRVDVG
jgi:hypothetical protein